MTMLDDLSLEEALRIAAESGWSGLLQVVSGEAHVGNVLMHHGRVAWAVCKDNKEDLGSYLRRCGRLTDAQLSEVRNRYESLGKTKKLARLLLEAQFIDQESLSECVKQHLSLTMSTLLNLPSVSIKAWECILADGEEFTYDLADVMEKKESISAPEPDFFQQYLELAEIQAFLKEMRDISGYRGALIAATGGRVLWSHGMEPERDFPRGLVEVPAAWLLSVRETATGAALGNVEFSCIECSGGILAASWLDERTGVFLAVRLERIGNLGITKRKLAAARGMIARLSAAKDAAPE